MNQKEFQLYVKRGPEPGKVYPLESVSISIGRDPMSDITVNDPEVSRRHALLIASENGYSIQDLGSTNGTLINGERLSGEKMELAPGQAISIGTGVILVFEVVSMGDEEEEPGDETVVSAPETVILDSSPEVEAVEEEVVEPEPAEMEHETVIDGFDYSEPALDQEPETLVETGAEQEQATIVEAEEELVLPPPVSETAISEQPWEFQQADPIEAQPIAQEVTPQEPVIVPQAGELTGPEPEKSGRRTTSIVVATLLLLCCCCSAFAIFMYYYGGDLLLRQLGFMQ